MPEDNKNNIENNDKIENNKDDNSVYIDEIDNLKKTTVAKDKYDKIVAERNALVTKLANGEDIDLGTSKKRTVEEIKKENDSIRKDLYGDIRKPISNLEYASKTLRLRDNLLELGEPDPFVGVKESSEEYALAKEKASNVADVMRDCINKANGDSNLFTALLQARTNEDSPMLTANLNKIKNQRR